MADRLRFGILGCARIARRGVIAAIRNSAGGQLVAIASRNGATAQDWANEFGIPRHYDSYEALIADPQVDAVYNPLPNELHREWTLKAAAAGKHVLCEKPLGLDLSDAEQIVAGCRQAGVVLVEAFMWRHHPRVARALQMLRAGQLGQLRLVKMDFSFDIDRTDWRLDPRRGGGPLYDLGCYGINAARLFAGAEPLEIIARAHRYETGVDMTTAMLLRFPGDVLALLDASFEAPYRNRIELVGTAGSLEFPDGVLPKPDAGLVLTTNAGVERISFEPADAYQGEIESFCQSVQAGQPQFPSEDGLANMRVLDQARIQAWGR